MSPPQVCPSSELLSDYLLGKLSEHEAISVTAHFKGCSDCMSRIDEVDESLDTIIYKLKHPTPDDDFMNEPECQQAVAALVGEPPTDLGQLRDYRLLRKLGEGGMGAVYEAVHTRLDQLVAVKILPPERMQCSESVARFRREMRAVGKLSHPNIVRAQDAGEVDGKHYLVMENVQGIDLSALVKRVGPLPVADACELTRQAAIGLQHVHEHGFVHRDIKPSNLMVTRDGEIKILDLGLARLHEDARESNELTFEGQVMGTLDYMAPEQLGDSHTVSILADIYGSGATLFKMLSGEAPYAGEKYNTPTKKLVAIATTPARPLEEFRKDVPKGVIVVLERMLAKNPDDRYATPGEVAEALEPFTKGCDLPTLVSNAAPSNDTQVAEVSVSTLAHVTSAHTDTTPTPTVPHIQLAPEVASSGSWFKPGWAVAAATTLVLIALFAVYYVTTNNGTLVVKIDDERVEVKLKQHGLVVHDLKNNRQWTIWKPGETKVSLGDHRLHVTDEAGLKIETEEFNLTRGGREIVTISLLPAASVDLARDGATRSSDRAIPRDPISNPPRVLQAPKWEPDRGPQLDAPLSRMALVSRPAFIKGASSWTIETVGHRGPVLAMEYSSDGRLLATTDDSENIRIWDPESGELLRILVGKTEPAVALAFSPNNRILAAACGTGGITLWDVANGRVLRVFGAGWQAKLESVAWEPDGKTLVATSVSWQQVDETYFFDTTTGELLDKAFIGAYAAYSPDGKKLATALPDGKIALWWAESFEHILDLALPEAKSESHRRFAWSPDGKVIAVGSVHHQVEASIWFVAANSGKVLAENKEPVQDNSRGRRLAWSPDSRQLAVSFHGADRSGGVQLLDAATGRNLHVFQKTADVIGDRFPSLAWSPDGAQIALGSTHSGSVHIHRVKSGPAVRELRGHGADAYIDALTWSRNGEWLHSLHDRGGRKWGSETGKLLEITDGFVISPEGTLGADWGHAPIRVYNRQHGEWSVLHALAPDSPLIGPVVLSWSHNGKVLLAGAGDGKIQLWEPVEPSLLKSFSVSSGVSGVALSPDGNTLAVVESADHRLTYFNVQTEQQMGSLRLSDFGPLTYSLDGNRLAVGQMDGRVDVWTADGGSSIWAVQGHRTGTSCVAWSPDGRTLASGAAAQCLVRLWSAETGEPRGSLVALRDRKGLAITADGHYSGTPSRIEREIVYVVQYDSGEQITLAPNEFSERYGWNNDPGRFGFASAVPAQASTEGNSSPRAPDRKPHDAVAAESSSAQTTLQQRETAKWLLSVGGETGVSIVGGPRKSVSPGDDLPKEPFEIKWIRFYSSPDITNDDVRRLRGLTRLEDIYIHNAEIGDDCLTHFTTMPGLETISLPRQNITGRGLESWVGLLELTNIDLSANPLDSRHLAVLADCQRLTSVNLADCGLSDDDLRHISPLTRLREIRLGGNYISHVGLQKLSGLAFLTNLHLGKTLVTDSVCEIIVHAFPNLKQLVLDSTQITDSGMSKLRDLRRLESLSIRETQIGDESLAIISEFKKLQSLYLSDTDVTDDGLRQLSKLKELQHMDLTGTEVSLEGMNWIKENLNLRELSGPSE